MKCSATQIILTIFNIVSVSNSRLFGVILKAYVVVVSKLYKLISKRCISLVTNANLWQNATQQIHSGIYILERLDFLESVEINGSNRKLLFSASSQKNGIA